MFTHRKIPKNKMANNNLKVLLRKSPLNLMKTVRLLSTKPNFETEGENSERETHFGFQKVKEHEKAQKVHRVFEDVADSYDIMNDAMSVGIHRIWKDVFMQRLNPTRNTKLLDVAGGTGDIAFRFLDYLKTTNNEQDCHVKVCDINSHMLDVGRVGDAEKLPFEDDYFTAYTIAFGIRNVTHIDKALEEAYRVLRPGGRFLCLEFSQLENSAAQWLYDLYSFQLIPVMGHLIAGQWQPYQYLVESIRQFPNQEMYKNMIEKAGFRQVTYENLTLGIVAIHSGFKL